VVGGRVPADVELEIGARGLRPSLTSIAMCIRVTASYWSIRVDGPSFRKSTDALTGGRGWLVTTPNRRAVGPVRPLLQIKSCLCCPGPHRRGS
jgi:hypothetical protein